LTKPVAQRLAKQTGGAWRQMIGLRWRRAGLYIARFYVVDLPGGAVLV